MQNSNEMGAAYTPIAEASGIMPHSDKQAANTSSNIESVALSVDNA